MLTELRAGMAKQIAGWKDLNSNLPLSFTETNSALALPHRMIATLSLARYLNSFKASI